MQPPQGVRVGERRGEYGEAPTGPLGWCDERLVDVVEATIDVGALVFACASAAAAACSPAEEVLVPRYEKVEGYEAGMYALGCDAHAPSGSSCAASRAADVPPSVVVTSSGCGVLALWET